MVTARGISWDITLFIGICGLLELRTIHGEKTCHVMYTEGSYYNPEVIGYYDLVPSVRCYDRPVYVKRNASDDDQIFFINYYRDNLFNMGWTVNTQMCSNDRRDSLLYVWNLNKRPDRVLLKWVEYDSYYWLYNKDFHVRCTEGLRYEAMVGIIVACILGIPAIIVVIVVLVDKLKNKHRVSQQQGTSRTHAPDSDLTRSAVHNPAFQGDSAFPAEFVPSCVMSPPTYAEATTDDAIVMSQQFQSGPPQGGLPPAYDIAITSPNGKIITSPYDLQAFPRGGDIITNPANINEHETIHVNTTPTALPPHADMPGSPVTPSGPSGHSDEERGCDL